MEDFPTLHGPRNKTIGLEVISPSAHVEDHKQSDGSEKSAHKMLRLLIFRLLSISSEIKGPNQSQENVGQTRFQSSGA